MTALMEIAIPGASDFDPVLADSKSAGLLTLCGKAALALTANFPQTVSGRTDAA